MITIPTCHVCTHPERHAIEQALGWGWAYRVIKDRWTGFSLMSLSRHRAHWQALQATSTVEAAEPPDSTAEALLPTGEAHATATEPAVTLTCDNDAAQEPPDVPDTVTAPTSQRYVPPPQIQTYGGIAVGLCAYCSAEAWYLYFEGGWNGESRNVCVSCAHVLAEQRGLTVPALRP